MTEDLRALALDAISRSQATADPDYPVVHAAPPVGRLNDPNGLVVDDGTYHAFYQLTPMHGTRRLVYWGHSSSTDLLHWQCHDPAIVPDSPYDASGAYSGNAIVLEGAEVDSAPSGCAYQLFYTGNLKDAEGRRTASQCLVTSPDLKTFTKWPDNPLIPTHAPGYTAHYRDPQVSRDPEAPGSFRMLVGVQREDETGAAVIYRSEDLLSWRLDGEITFPDAGTALDRFGYMWECPALVTLTDELTGQEWDVLIWCPQGARPEGAEGYENVFPCVYTIGHLVGTQLRDCDGTVHEVDRGFEYYAPQAFARPPGQPGPVLLTGWAGNAGEDDQPSIATGGWVHALTLPRALALRGGRLIQRAVTVAPSGETVELNELAETIEVTGAAVQRVLAGHRSWHLVADIGDGLASSSGSVQVRIGSQQCHMDIRLDLGRAPRLIVDRTTSRYAGRSPRRVVGLDPAVIGRVEIVHDRSITEIFVGDGDLAFTARCFVDSTEGAELTVAGGAGVTSLSASAFD